MAFQSTFQSQLFHYKSDVMVYRYKMCKSSKLLQPLKCQWLNISIFF